MKYELLNKALFIKSNTIEIDKVNLSKIKCITRKKYFFIWIKTFDINSNLNGLL